MSEIEAIRALAAAERRIDKLRVALHRIAAVDTLEHAQQIAEDALVFDSHILNEARATARARKARR